MYFSVTHLVEYCRGWNAVAYEMQCCIARLTSPLWSLLWNVMYCIILTWNAVHCIALVRGVAASLTPGRMSTDVLSSQTHDQQFASSSPSSSSPHHQQFVCSLIIIVSHQCYSCRPVIVYLFLSKIAFSGIIQHWISKRYDNFNVHIRISWMSIVKFW